VIHGDHREPMRKAGLLLALLALGMVLVWSLPPPAGAGGIAGYGPLHTLFETIAVVIAVLVFAVGWNANNRELPGSTVLLACGFLGVALLDFSHALSFAGMPDYVTPSNPEKAINFWLVARTLAALALLAVAVAPSRPLIRRATRYLLLAAVLAATAFAHWLFLFRPDIAPRTFVPGLGLTPFKIASEYLLIALYLTAAVALWLRMRRPQAFNAAALFVAVCTMAMSEFFFTLYASVTDVYNLMGHLYKVIAYLFLYRAIFVEAVERPYSQLQAAQDRLRSTLETIPDLVWLKDVDGVFLECNPAVEHLYGSSRAEIVGKSDYDFAPKALADSFREHDRKAMAAGGPSVNEEWLTFANDGYRGLFETIKTPMRDAQGRLIGVLGIARDITAARAAQEAQRLSEQRLQQAVRVARIGIFDHDHLTDTIHWSTEQREIYGLGPDEVVTLAVYLEHVFPADLDAISAAVQRAHDPAGDGLFDVEHRIVRRDGQIRFLTTRSLTSFIGEGSQRHKLHTIGAVLDITERKRAEEVLRTSEESLAVTLQSIGDAVIATDLDGRVTRMNTVAEELTGWPFALARGRPLADVFNIINAESRARVPSPTQRVLASGEILDLANHTMLLARNGAEYHISDSAAPIRDASGKVMGVVLVFSDVSEQYRAQQALRVHAEALRLRDRALTQISQGVMITDASWVISYVNPGFERLTGYSAGETLGRTAKFLQGAQTSKAAAADLGRALRAGEEYRGEILNYRKDGAAIWIALDISPIRDDSGALTGFVGTQRDITERKQAEVERRSLESQLRESQKMESIGTLAGGIAHDFNNILGAILGNVALARGDLPAEHPAHQSLDQIGKASLRARDLVQQILAFSRRQAQELVGQPLQPLVEESLSLLRATLPARCALEAKLTDAPLYVYADGTQIQQVLMNLCTNAWHALADGLGTITVGLDEQLLETAAAQAVGAWPPGRYAHLWVRDTGIGMDAQTRARIFEPFFTTKPAGQGTGLGLSVVHGIVAAHQGAISVDSAPGEGSTFHLYLPAQQQLETSPTSESTRPAALEGHGEHVLYIDDDEVMLLMVDRLLQRSGYRSTCCHSTQDALAALRAAPQAFDAVVTDYNMPEASGLELAGAISRIRPDLPVVISSGYVSEELRSGAERLGVRHLLQKQNTFDELPGLLRRVLAD
jgi:PAS domain S-box-containing protein